ncbi:MAG: hypothetical protein M3N16_01405 [Actinomycetota bacterium]|nr:hypothetical protein [Actinomycetota bacterium]
MDKKSVPGQPAVRLCNYTDVYYRDTITPDQEFMEATATLEQVEAFRLLPGDVITQRTRKRRKTSASPRSFGTPHAISSAAITSP